MAHDDTHHVNYLYVFLALCGFTALSVAFDGLTGLVPHSVVVVLVLAVAVAKAMCVMMFFMHLKFEGNWKYVLLAPTTILAIGLPIALYPDIGVAYYTRAAPQQEWLTEIEEFKAHHSHDENEHIKQTGDEQPPAHGSESEGASDGSEPEQEDAA